jgi:hypothetical protein
MGIFPDQCFHVIIHTYIYIYICMYIYTHIYIHICIHIYIHIYIYTQTFFSKTYQKWPKTYLSYVTTWENNMWNVLVYIDMLIRVFIFEVYTVTSNELNYWTSFKLTEGYYYFSISCWDNLLKFRVFLLISQKWNFMYYVDKEY